MASETKSRTIRFGILTVSDTCSSGSAIDDSGANLRQIIKDKKLINGDVTVKKIVPDELKKIQETLTEWSDIMKIDVVLTTGGTGFTGRDITPEATKSVIDRDAVGFTVAMLTGSLKLTPLAMLSRLTCGIRKGTLIINLPGSTKAAEQCFRLAVPGLQHAVDQLHGAKDKVGMTHEEMQWAGTIVQNEPQSKIESDKIAMRPRKTQHGAIIAEEALNVVLEKAFLVGNEDVPFRDCLGRYLSEDVFSKGPFPPFPASIKDGYAVLAADGDGLREVMGGAAAGDVPDQPVTPGLCMRINTGAPLPPGADAVVQVEDTKLTKYSQDGRTELEIKILTVPKSGREIRRVGCDIRAQQIVLSKGQRLGPSELGLLATIGVDTVQCYRQPNVGVMSTGNELVEPDAHLRKGKIRDANRTSLLSQLREFGIMAQDLGIVPDNPHKLMTSIKNAFDHCDVLVTTGGVSMGDRDYIKQILKSDFKANIHFATVFMKPGKPTTFATLKFKGETKLFFGLPGNPVSAIVTLNLFVLPAIAKMSGSAQPRRTIVKARLAHELKLDTRPEYHRAVLSWSPTNPIPEAVSTGNQISSRLLSMCTANALLVLPAITDARQSVQQGEIVNAVIIGKI